MQVEAYLCLDNVTHKIESDQSINIIYKPENATLYIVIYYYKQIGDYSKY